MARQKQVNHGVACALLCGFLVAGCSSEYRIKLIYPDDAAWQRAAAVELVVVEGDRCAWLMQGRPPADQDLVAWQQFAARDEPALGRLRYGTLSFFARVRDGSCVGYLEGCRSQEIRERESATVQMVLAPCSERGCAVDQRCVSGRCIALDGGAADSDAGRDSGADDAAAIDAAAADAATTDTATSDTATTDAAMPDTAMPDAATTDASMPDTARTDAATTDAVTTDAATPDAAAPDAAMPDTAIADVGQADAWLPPGLTWVPIPGGTYDMGCSPNDTDCYSNENPRHAVTISAFELTATEITQQQYQDVIGSNPSYHTDCPTCPVEQVNWQQASDFCAAIGGRLPTEAEWEYATRAGTTTMYYCGDYFACLAGIAWYYDNSDTGSGRQTHPVGGKTANDFGLFDMLGNVFEWNADWFDGNYYSSSPSQDPTGPATGTYRVVRGGSFGSGDFGVGLRASGRYLSAPGVTDSVTGFRCAR
ncbi:MAG: formylglycine-generating enzyme family protein [Deltaproteobacteria bacterium]|nr:formylglycine-generating enzyme family protein [Deltaproteobacteria bacterium]